MLSAYRKIPNASPGLIEVRKHFLADLYWGAYIRGGSFGLASDLCMPEYSPFGVQSERLITTFKA